MYGIVQYRSTEYSVVCKRIVTRVGLSFGGYFCGNRNIIHDDTGTFLTVKFILLLTVESFSLLK
jgi:hypothetical protein